MEANRFFTSITCVDPYMIDLSQNTLNTHGVGMRYTKIFPAVLKEFINF